MKNRPVTGLNKCSITQKQKTLDGGLGNVHYHFPPTKAVFNSMPKITNPWKNMDGIKAWTLTGEFLERNLT